MANALSSETGTKSSPKLCHLRTHTRFDVPATVTKISRMPHPSGQFLWSHVPMNGDTRRIVKLIDQKSTEDLLVQLSRQFLAYRHSRCAISETSGGIWNELIAWPSREDEHSIQRGDSDILRRYTPN